MLLLRLLRRRLDELLVVSVQLLGFLLIREGRSTSGALPCRYTGGRSLRLRHLLTYPGSSRSLSRGGLVQHWEDFRNSSCREWQTGPVTGNQTKR